MTIPEGAQRSEDGNYWWDDQNQQWQLIDQNAQQAGGQGDAAQAAAGQGAAAGGTPQEQARVQAGLPAEVHAANDEQKQPYYGEPNIEIHPLDTDQSDVPEMQEEQA